MKAIQRMVATAMLITCAVGCAFEHHSSFNFTVIDSSTGGPIAGVTVDGGGYGHHFENRLFYDEEFKKATTNEQGVAAIRNITISHGWQYLFSFEKDGYRALAVNADPLHGDAKASFTYKEVDYLPSRQDAWNSDVPLRVEQMNKIIMWRLSAAPETQPD